MTTRHMFLVTVVQYDILCNIVREYSVLYDIFNEKFSYFDSNNKEKKVIRYIDYLVDGNVTIISRKWCRDRCIEICFSTIYGRLIGSKCCFNITLTVQNMKSESLNASSCNVGVKVQNNFFC